MLLIACFLAYAATRLVNMCVPTVISSMVDENFLTKSQSGLLSGIFYLVYGTGQLIFGKYFNNHSSFYGIKLALLSSITCCLFMSLTDDFYLLLLIWSVCALFNSAFFPAVMKTVSFVLSFNHSVFATKYLMIAHQAGTVLCLLAGGIIMKYTSWINLYYFAALTSVVSFIYWIVCENIAKKVSDFPQKSANNTVSNVKQIDKSSISKYIGTGVFCIFGVSFFNALLSGIQSWAPTIIMETYKTTPSFSVLLNIVVIFANVSLLFLLGKLVTKNKIKCLVICYCISFPLIIFMNYTSFYSEYVYILLLSGVASISLYASNVCVIQVPAYFQKYNDVSRICGISNMCASFALMIGNYSYGVLADKFGWGIIMVLCAVFVTVCIILSLIAMPLFKRFIKSSIY